MMMDQATIDFMQAIAKTAQSETEARFAELLAAMMQRMDAQTARLEAAISAPRALKGSPVRAFENYAANALSDYPVDCRGYNAVLVQVFTGGSSISATVSIEGASEAGGNYLALPEANASQSVTVDGSFVVHVGASFVKARIASRTGGTFTVIVTPFVAAGQSPVAQGSLTSRSGTITTGGAAQTLAAANPNRRFISIQNVSDDTLWIDFGATAVQDQPSFKLLPNTDFTPIAFIPTAAISIIGPTTGQAFVGKEG